MNTSWKMVVYFICIMQVMATDESGSMHTQSILTFDIVVPSYRVNEVFLSGILGISIPPGTAIEWYIVIDNPKNILSEKFKKQWPNAHFIQNVQNVGASLSRNSGFEAGSSEWVIFIDDDLIPSPYFIDGYVEAIRSGDGTEPGFAGVIRFPQTTKSFPKAILASGYINWYGMALKNEPMYWAVSANFCVHRSRIGPVRFGIDFPKSGGGEDIEYGIQVFKHTGKKFGTAPKAEVLQQWWFNGTRTFDAYARFYRWGHGDATNLKHTEFVFRSLPNAMETMAFIFCYSCIMLIGLAPGSIKSVIQFVLVFLICDIVGESIFQGLKGNSWSPLFAADIYFIHCIYDFGFLSRVLSERPHHIMARNIIWYHIQPPIQTILVACSTFVTFMLMFQDQPQNEKKKKKKNKKK